ncbi:PEP-CTERM sorting domain-containing protein [Paucibacter sp. AS339]|uniref:PEP-CTERM sorting domain-containing protein n=1 Tax=Paucibacter hankyongi TaxID=3133434 RepID=UPI00309A3A19
MKTALSIKTLSRISAFAAAGMLAMTFTAAHATSTVTDVTGAGTSLVESHSLVFGNRSAASTSMGAWKVNESGSNVASGSSFWVYCLDPLNGFNTSTPGATYDKTMLNNFVTGGGYATLFAGSKYQASNIQGMYDDSTTTTSRVLADLTTLYSHAYYDSLTSGVKSAAFQFAIWEIEGDGKGKSDGNGNSDGKYYAKGYAGSGLDNTEAQVWDANSGKWVDTAFTKQVNAYLAALNGTIGWSSVNGADLSGTTNFTYNVYKPNPAGDSQVLLSVTAGNKVPEPGSLALAGLALFGVVYTRRQGKAKND